MNQKRHILTLLLCLTWSAAAFAQGKKFEQSREFGLVGGTAYYIGDINPYQHFGGDLNLAFGAMYRENLDKRWSVKGQILYGMVGASDAEAPDAWRQNRNLSFRNEIIEGAVTVELNYKDYQIGNSRDRFSPYLFAGIGFYSHKPQAEFRGRWYELQPLGTEGQGTTEGDDPYALSGICLPFGVGVKANLFSIVAVSLEWGMRKIYTDYLDDVSTAYVSPAVLAEENGELSAILANRSETLPEGLDSYAGLQRGDPGRNDWYSFATLTISIRLGKPPTTCWNQ